MRSWVTVMDPVDEIARAQSIELVDEDGAAVTLTVAPGLQAREIEAVEAEVGVALPRELRDLLGETAGVRGILESIDFTGRSVGGFELAEVFPWGLAIADDGFGNAWVLDLTPEERDLARVFFACHDAPVILYQSPSIGHFLHEVFKLYVPPHASLVDDVHEDRLFDVWGTNPGVLTPSAALGAGDEVLGEFATTLDDDFELVDLRAAPVGMGFSWGRYGPRTELRRHRYHRVFAYRRPPRPPHLLRGLFKPRRRPA